jgi:2,3-bisphosphoglycerate-independent phosphoglycerate mutase
MRLDVMEELSQPADSKIVLLVLDGVGGLRRSKRGQTALEMADTPNLDALAEQGECGLQLPVGPGITPGSGPGHLGLFGYNPLDYRVGRGVLSALGIGFDLQDRDVAARGNFCTIEDGTVVDRRAGRISTDRNEKLCQKLREIDVPGVELHVETVKEHRFLLVLRGDGLHGDISDTDPHETGREPERPTRGSPAAEETAEKVATFVDRAREKLADEQRANGVLLRGFSKRPDWPTFPQACGLRSACIADYPMYRGVSRLVGMNTLEAGETIEEKFQKVSDRWDEFDLFFVHEKRTDSSGEDGDFDMKSTVAEEVDKHVPMLMDLDPDVVIATGDHSTPAKMKKHSWHPVPVFVWGENVRADDVDEFGERYCRKGALGPQFPARDLMSLAMANAGRLTKFGA